MTQPAPLAVLRVDLGAIAANWRLLGARHPGAVAAVVKADGYGLGAVQVARRLFAEGCRHFFTAHLAEALTLREALPGGMIAALNGLWPADAPLYRHHAITPVLGSLAELTAWRGLGEAIPAILHLDTGMSRLGLDAAEQDALAAEPERLAGMRIAYVMTHLACSDAPGDPANGAQAARFEAACARLPAAPRSLAASSGLFLGPAFASDLARPGAALYGINPTPGRANPMRNPVRLWARVLQLRDIGAGEAVGYNGLWRAARPTRIATVAVGYADGFSRHLSNQGGAAFGACVLPLVGRVSMDLTTYDATDAPGLEAGDWLEVMGPHQDADRLAGWAGTNAYEVMTQLGRRYERVYA